jgi:histidine triad (HIT) family protein
MYNHAPPGYECPVCKIVAGAIGDNAVVAENNHAFAIVSRRVWSTGPGPVLVVPRSHFENLYDVDDDAGLDIHRLTRKIAIAFKEAFNCDGTSTRQHNEPGNQHDMWHLHVHVFPRDEGDNLYGARFRGSTIDERSELATRLQAAL